MNSAPKFCENCGTSLTQGVNFCEACGHPVKATSVQVGKSLDTSPPKQSYDKKSTPVPRSSFKTIIWVLVGVCSPEKISH
jgi:uncharacterized membrane protein YvbJ